jgi:hypothetical protein
MKVNPLTEDLKSVVSKKAKYCEQNSRTTDRKLSANRPGNTSKVISGFTGAISKI